jgi:hypothetical protein
MDTAKIANKFEAAQNALVLQASDLSLQTIAQMVESGAIDVSPKYQRRERWKAAAQAELIESFLINVPVPPVYLAEDDFGTYSVIDGKQRITTIHRYLLDKFSLEGLKEFPELNGLKFSQLPKQLQNALSIRPYLRVVTLLKQTDSELKYEVFTRLNTGGEPLLPQEIRNALYRGSLNDLLFKLSGNMFLRQQLKIKTSKETPYREMQDVECVLRFFCLSSEWKNFSGDMRRSLDAYAAKNQSATKSNLDAAAKKFNIAIERCEALWGQNAFRRHDEKKGYRDQFMFAVYDAEMIAALELSDTKFKAVKARKSQVTQATLKLFKDPEFADSVRVSTNSPSKVLYRIRKVKEMLARIA